MEPEYIFCRHASSPSIPPGGPPGRREPTISYYAKAPRRERFSTTYTGHCPYPEASTRGIGLSLGCARAGDEYKNGPHTYHEHKIHHPRNSVLIDGARHYHHRNHHGLAKEVIEPSQQYTDLLDSRIEELQETLAEHEQMNVVMSFLILDLLRCHMPKTDQSEQVEAAVRKTLCDGTVLDRIELAIALPQFVESCRLAQQLDNYTNISRPLAATGSQLASPHSTQPKDGPVGTRTTSSSSSTPERGNTYSSTGSEEAQLASVGIPPPRPLIVPPLKDVTALGSSGWMKGVSTAGEYIPPDTIPPAATEVSRPQPSS